jgi:two-component system sensor histidine kinase UhpB
MGQFASQPYARRPDASVGTSKQPAAAARWLLETPHEIPKLLGPEELRVVLLYVVFASLWIIGSDLLLEVAEDIPVEAVPLQTIKGLNFVFTTAALLFVVLRRSYTRWRVAEEDLRQSEQRFASVARAVTNALWDWELATDGIWWSDGFFRLFGYARAEVEPTIADWRDKLHPDDRERVVRSLDLFVAQGGSLWTEDYRLRRRDGSYAFVHDRGVLVRDADGKVVRMVGGISDITERRKAEENLERSHQQLRAFSAKLQSLREEEGARIAREIHDELGQMLTGLKMDLRWIERRLSEGTDTSLNPLLDKVVAASELADATIGCVQRIAAELRPGALDTLGLAPAVQNEASRFQERTGIVCRVQCPDFAPAPTPDVATTTFRILQEALTNVTRHAQATEVSIQLWMKDGELHLEVADNGLGIRETDLADSSSLGLLGMRERAALLGGEVSIGGGPRGGTVVALRLPASLGAAPPAPTQR